MSIALFIVWALPALVVVVATVFSMIPGRAWYLRVCDFPRTQLLVAGVLLLAVAVAALAVAVDPPVAAILAVGLPLLAAVALQAWWTLRLTPLIPPEVARPETDAPLVRFITANVDYTNKDRRDALDRLLSYQPDILALVETDEAWGPLIDALADTYPWRMSDLRPEGRGMVLISRLRIETVEVREVVEPDRPSIWARIELPGGRLVSVVILHPPPPGLPRRHGEGRVSSRPRDIELHAVAATIRENSDQLWIVAGDLNDVGWSATTMHAKREAGLVDPRIGRGMYSTYPAEWPFFRFPIDHLLLSPAFRLATLRRLEPIGSDHLPLLADLQLPPPA